jgi:hypothetical protein
MKLASDTSLEERTQRIIQKAQPKEDRKNLALFLANALLFIKKARGESLPPPKNMPSPHPRISFTAHLDSSPELADFFEQRLDLIERYKITDVHRIIDIMTAFSYLPPYPFEIRLSPRKVRLLIQLYENPVIPNTQLARKINSTPRTIRKELEDLRRYFGFTIANFLDYHKFKLAHMLVIFRTKSLDHSKELVYFVQGERPLFLRAFTFDEDYRVGFMTFTIPDQPKGHQLFDQRLTWFQDNYFQEWTITRTLEASYSMSFDAYDTKSNSWVCDSPLVSEAMLQFIQSHSYSIPKPHSLKYTKPMQFTQLDFLLGQLARNHVRPLNIEFIQKELDKRGFELAKKTIWAKLLRFRKEKIHVPMVYYEAAFFESFITLHIQCKKNIRDQVALLPSLLPYAFISILDSGVLISFHQPSRCGAITGQLVQALGNCSGVTDVVAIRRGDNIGTPSTVDNYIRWDESRQRWLLHEGDI